MMKRHHDRLGRLLSTAAAFFVFQFCLAPTFADSIQLGTVETPLWIDNVTFDSFDGNELHYLVNSVPNKQYLGNIGGFKMTAYPQLEEAEKALKAGDAKQVLASYKAVRGKAREPWLRIWLDARMVPLMEKSGEHLGAVNTYIALIDSKAPQKLLEDPPVRSVASLSKDEKAKVHEKLKAVRKTAKDKTPLADSLDELLEVSDPGAEPTVVPPGAEADGLASEVPLPMFMLANKPDVITKLLARGRFEQALERVNDEMKTAAGGGKTSLLLFQRGIAQFYVAESMAKDAAKKDEARTLFEDAGLSFYRIPTYFRNSPYVGPALLETAAVHVRINRPDVARKLLSLAEGQIDPDDKALKGRIEALHKQLATLTNN